MSIPYDTLICIFSHNNAVLLRNCIASIDQFFPDSHILILDDGSSETAVGPLLQSLQQRPNISVLRNDLKHGDASNAFVLDDEVHSLDKPSAFLNDTERDRLTNQCQDSPSTSGTFRPNRHGHFYLNQKLAMRIAIKRGYQFAWFIEDDMQLVRDAKPCVQSVRKKFEQAPSICQIAVQFLLRPGRYDFETLREAGVYQPNRRYNSNGIFHLDRLRARPELVDAIADDVPEGNLRVTSHRWDQLGAGCWFDAFPVQAHVPWPHLLRSGKATLCGDLAIKAMSQAEIQILLARDVTTPPFAEYFLSLNYRTTIPGPPWWYNEAFIERYLDLCRDELAAERLRDRPFVQFPLGEMDEPKANYWSPPKESGSTPTVNKRPPRCRDHLRWIPGLESGFCGYKRLRQAAKTLPYRRFCKRVQAERQRVLGHKV